VLLLLHYYYYYYCVSPDTTLAAIMLLLLLSSSLMLLLPLHVVVVAVVFLKPDFFGKCLKSRTFFCRHFRRQKTKRKSKLSAWMNALLGSGGGGDISAGAGAAAAAAAAATVSPVASVSSVDVDGAVAATATAAATGGTLAGWPARNKAIVALLLGSALLLMLYAGGGGGGGGGASTSTAADSTAAAAISTTTTPPAAAPSLLQCPAMPTAAARPFAAAVLSSGSSNDDDDDALKRLAAAIMHGDVNQAVELARTLALRHKPTATTTSKKTTTTNAAAATAASQEEQRCVFLQKLYKFVPGKSAGLAAKLPKVRAEWQSLRCSDKLAPKANKQAAAGGGGDVKARRTACTILAKTYGIVAFETYGTAPVTVRHRWTSLRCDDAMTRASEPADLSGVCSMPFNAQRAATGKKVIAFSVYGADPKYVEGAIRNTKLLQSMFPGGWTLRAYCKKGKLDIPPASKQRLRDAGVDVVTLPAAFEIPPMFWRFLPVCDDSVDRFIARDTDSRLNHRDYAAVQLWERSNLPVHSVRDHPSHANFAFSGGLWGAVRGGIPGFTELLARQRAGGYMADMNFLNGKIWPLVSSRTYQTDSFSCNRWHSATSTGFPTGRDFDGQHVGQVFNIVGQKDEARMGDVRLLRNGLHSQRRECRDAQRRDCKDLGWSAWSPVNCCGGAGKQQHRVRYSMPEMNGGAACAAVAAADTHRACPPC
jgi:hypothetical protein